jgi:hypothetical protein
MPMISTLKAYVGLKINEKNIKYMIAVGNRTILDARQAFGDKIFEGINEFVYLGALVTPKNNVSLEIQQKIQTAIGTSAVCENICSHLTWHARYS